MYSVINGSFRSEDFFLVCTIFQKKNLHINAGSNLAHPGSFKILEPPLF